MSIDHPIAPRDFRDFDILILPGWRNSGSDHWQTLWESVLPNARRVVQDDWEAPVYAAWAARLTQAVEQCDKPVLFVAHSLGTALVTRWAHETGARGVAGAFLAATSDRDRWEPQPGEPQGFAPMVLAELPFPSTVLASTNDPRCDFERSRVFAAAWGSRFVNVGALGHIGSAAGLGLWPAGLIWLGELAVRIQDRAAAAVPGQRPAAAYRGRIYPDITATVGDTPLVRLSRLEAAHEVHARLVAKLEFFNPLASVKDRIAVAMIEAAEREGRIAPGATLIEATSGNTGIGLAFAAAAKGYKLILTMPESMSQERRKMLKILGAQLELTPAAESMGGAIRRAHELLELVPGSILVRQFDNPANPAVHRVTTAEEIWRDTAGEVDFVVSGIGTGGTITGVGRTLKQYKPDVRMIAVEPEGSAVLSGGKPGPHKIQGIGSGFLSTILDLSLVDEILTAGDEESIALARQVARTEGIPVGISSGAALAAAIRVGRRPENAGKLIVTIIPSFAERYVSTALFEGL